MSTTMLRQMLMPSLLRASMPATKAVVRFAFLRPSASITPIRSFSSTPSQNATLNQVLRVSLLFECPPPSRFFPSTYTNKPLTQQQIGMPKRTTSSPRRLPRLGWRQRPPTQRRMHQSRHYTTQEAQLWRTKNGTCAPDDRKDHHGIYSRRGPQHPAAQRCARARRACPGLSRCAVQVSSRCVGLGWCHEPDQCAEQVRHEEAQEGGGRLEWRGWVIWKKMWFVCTCRFRQDEEQCNIK